MVWNRRSFLRAALTGAAAIPLAGAAFATDILPRGSSTTHDDTELLNDLERAAFEFFWNEANPHTGLIRDRANADGVDARLTGSIAALGFGLTGLCIGYERGFRSHIEITERVRKTLRFLAHDAPTINGFLYHFVNIENGNRSGFSELSPIDMAIFLCGVLTCREFFYDNEIRRDATEIYNRVQWPWALNGGNTFSLDWTPELGFSKLRWDSYSELMMLYLLAIGSPAHPIPVQSWHDIKRPWLVYQGYRYISVPAPLFIHQFSHAWFDFRDRQDQYSDYFQNSVIACKAHRQFCQQLSGRFPCYSEKVWGITASDSSRGYVAWGGPPMQGPIDGSIVPAAAAGSLPFIYPEAIAVLKNLRAYYGKQIWKRYGFVDAFNPLTGWAASDVIGIDVGISMLMAENARTQFVWNTFMRNREVTAAMELVGFRSAAKPLLAGRSALVTG